MIPQRKYKMGSDSFSLQGAQPHCALYLLSERLHRLYTFVSCCQVFVPMRSKVCHSTDFCLTYNLPFNSIGMSHGLGIDVQVASGISVTACATLATFVYHMN